MTGEELDERVRSFNMNIFKILNIEALSQNDQWYVLFNSLVSCLAHAIVYQADSNATMEMVLNHLVSAVEDLKVNKLN
jgi:hypothetical protein